jgi:hypothetical protein
MTSGNYVGSFLKKQSGFRPEDTTIGHCLNLSGWSLGQFFFAVISGMSRFLFLLTPWISSSPVPFSVGYKYRRISSFFFQ